MQIFNNWCDTLKHHWIKFSRNIHGKEFLNCILEKVAGVQQLRKDNGRHSQSHIAFPSNWQTTPKILSNLASQKNNFKLLWKSKQKFFFLDYRRKVKSLENICKLHHKILCWPRKLPHAPDISLRRKLHQSVSFLLRNEWNRKSHKTI